MSDLHHQAEFLLTRGYVTGMTKEQLVEKLEKNLENPVPENAHTRESVYDEKSLSFVEKRRNDASEQQKRLISPGERTSAALETWLNGIPSNQD